ncbi:hypothetical protein [Jatrophihabitans sp. GAS493]|uniref:hypothetical protein n=1 Tax=Jatrophihabitans sp. GAS493 TaxID=1907575 RepID=UPI000BB921BB|nr:hypothetical protein [Jatrophihabitans sp. GAS493]
MFVAIGRRFVEIDGATYGALMAIELFTTVLPLMILSFGYFSDFASDASIGNLVDRQLDLTGATEENVRQAFGSADALRSTWTVLGLAGFLIWGIPMAITVAGMFAKAWRREQYSILERLWRGAIWFVVYLSMLIVRERISFGINHKGLLEPVFFALSLVPVWLFWTLTPVLLVRDGARGKRVLAEAGLAGVLIDGVVLALATRLIFPYLLAGWTSFGPIGVAMGLMTWCAVLGYGWVTIACFSGVVWERSAPLPTVMQTQTDEG